MHDMFGLVHLIALGVSFAIIVLAILFVDRISFDKLLKILLYGGIISETIKVFVYIIINTDNYGGMGYLPKTDLPFHLCSIQIIFIFILNFSKNENLKRKLLAFMLPSCLIGGFMALLIATSSSRSIPWITVQYFGYHTMITCFSIYLIKTKEIKFNIKDYFDALKLLALFCFIAIYLNSWINDGSNKINFMYVVAPPQDGLPFLNMNQGWFVYFIRYALVALVSVSLVYIGPIIRALKKENK